MRFRGFVGGRGAYIYEDAHERGAYRVRFELHPQHAEAGSGWFGGRVSLRLRWSKSEAEDVARRWVDGGALPEGM
jgi:hypothetical protein